jgi:hypothetical protein
VQGSIVRRTKREAGRSLLSFHRAESWLEMGEERKAIETTIKVEREWSTFYRVEGQYE